MTEPAVSPSDRREEMIVPPAYALFGEVVLVGFASILAKALSVFGFDVNWWVLAVPAGLIGLVVGAVGGWNWVRQQRLMREAIARMGFKPLPDKTTDEIEKRIKFICANRITLSSAMGRSLGKARLMIAVMKTHSENHGNTSSSSTTETIAWYESKSLDLPKFRLVPEGLVLRRIAAMVGLQDINFEDSPEFSSNYHLSGDIEGPIRALFSPEVRDHYATRLGWQLIGQKSRLLLLRPRKVCRPGQLEEFVRDAVQAFRLLNASEQNVADYHAEHGPVTDEDVLDEFEKKAGPNVSRTVMTTAELKEFLAQPVPRELTPSLKKRYASDWFLRIFGLIFATVGVALLVLSLVMDVDPEDRKGMCGLGVGLASIGGLVVWSAGVAGRRAAALLRNGTLARGRVDDVKETSIIMSNQRRHHAHVRFKFDGSTQRAICNLYGRDVTVALEMANDGRTVNVMVDPQDPYQILLLDTLTLSG